MRNSRIITLNYIHTEKNLTDPFTKGLTRNVGSGKNKLVDSTRVSLLNPLEKRCNTLNIAW
jgi:hypothetical protein